MTSKDLGPGSAGQPHALSLPCFPSPTPSREGLPLLPELRWLRRKCCDSVGPSWQPLERQLISDSRFMEGGRLLLKRTRAPNSIATNIESGRDPIFAIVTGLRGPFGTMCHQDTVLGCGLSCQGGLSERAQRPAGVQHELPKPCVSCPGGWALGTLSSPGGASPDPRFTHTHISQPQQLQSSSPWAFHLLPRWL